MIVFSLIALFIFVLFVASFVYMISHISKNVPRQSTEDFNSSVLAISYDNQPTGKTYTKNLVHLLRKNKYDYIILGENDNYKGWYTRFLAYRNEIVKHDDEKLLFICDGRDVLINNQSPETMINIAKSMVDLDKKIIFGAETGCCTPVKDKENIVSFMKNIASKRRPNYKHSYYYLNFGTMLGKAKNIKFLFQNLGMEKGADDQSLTYLFFQKYPNKIFLDYQQILFSTTHGTSPSPFEYNKEKKKIFQKITKTVPVVLHFQGRGYENKYNECSKKLMEG